jgi:hypothetical protein
MPKKLMSCVKQVMAQGKDKSSAFGICVKSTGLKSEHHKGDKGKKK